MSTKSQPEEIFDVVDAEDRVIGVAPRSEVHRRGLLHRAVHVFVFRSDGRLLVQKRSATKDEFPLTYTSSASGHVSSGEDYDECARRELEEEVGIGASLERLVKLPAAPELANEHSVLYLARSDDEPTPDPVEVDSVSYFTLDELKTLLAENASDFSPPFRTLLEWYFKNRGSSDW